MAEYFFVGASLPDLQVGTSPELSSEEFFTLCDDNLHPWDLKKIETLRRLYDLDNLLAFWKKEPLDPRGNLDFNDLEEALLTEEGLPDYVYEFLNTYESTQERVQNFSALIAAYFRREIEGHQGFLKKLLVFERDLRLVLAGFRAKLLKRDLVKELQFEDPDDDLVAQILAQKDAKQFEPPVGYEDLKGIFEENKDDALALHQAICEYRFSKISELSGVAAFNMDKLLAYFDQLCIVEKWLELDKQKGSGIVDTIIKGES